MGLSLTPSVYMKNQKKASPGEITIFQHNQRHKANIPWNQIHAKTWTTHGQSRSSSSQCGKFETTLESELHCTLRGQDCLSHLYGFRLYLELAFSSMASMKGRICESLENRGGANKRCVCNMHLIFKVCTVTQHFIIILKD